MKKANKQRMAKYDPENAYAWNKILSAIRDLRTEGKTQKEIAQILGVNKDTISRWLSENRGGERSTFGMMIRCARALKISVDELLEDAPTCKPQKEPTSYDKEVAATLERYTKTADLTITDIANKTSLTPIEVNSVFAGESPASPTVLKDICEVIEVGATMVLKEATKSLNEKIERDTAADAEERSA